MAMKGWSSDRCGNIVKIHVSTQGSNTNSGLTPQDPVRDIGRGIERLLDQYQNPSLDQGFLLLKRGERWEERVVWPPQLRGRSPERPVVMGSYGAGDRPKLVSKGSNRLSSIYTVIQGGFADNNNPGENIAFTDLHIIAEDTERGNPGGIVLLRTWRNILIENCLFEGGFEKNIVVQGIGANRPSNIAVRRCVVVDANSAYPAHANGMFFDEDIRIYEISSGNLVGTLPTPISAAAGTQEHLGGTYGGAAILVFPWPE
jgi:hypothetical protein